LKAPSEIELDLRENSGEELLAGFIELIFQKETWSRGKLLWSLPVLVSVFYALLLVLLGLEADPLSSVEGILSTCPHPVSNSSAP